MRVTVYMNDGEIKQFEGTVCNWGSTGKFIQIKEANGNMRAFSASAIKQINIEDTNKE